MEIINLLSDKELEIIKLFNKTKLFYNTIFKNNMINTKNYYYNSTLYEGINIFEIVLTKAIILEYLNKNIYKLDSNIEVNILYNDYKNIDNYILKLNKCYDKVINNLKLNKDTYNYLLLCKKNIINNIVFHIKNNILDIIV